MPIIRAKTRVEEYAARARYFPAENMAARNRESTLQVARNIAEFLPATDGAILDVGCGDGALLGMLKGERVGVAPSIEEVEKLRMLWPDVRFEVGLAQSIPLPDKSVSLLICNAVLLVLESEVEVLQALREFARVSSFVFIGEIPTLADSRVPSDSIHSWLWALLKTGGPKSFLAGVRDVAVAATTEKPLLFHPSRGLVFERDHFLSLCSLSRLRLIRDRATPHLASRRDYLLLTSSARVQDSRECST